MFRIVIFLENFKWIVIGTHMWLYDPETVSLGVARLWLFLTLQWCHDERDGVSNQQPLDYLLNRLFRCTSKKHQRSASLSFVRGTHQWPVDSPHKSPVMRKMFPFYDVIIIGHFAVSHIPFLIWIPNLWLHFVHVHKPKINLVWG